jgi:hypothetical protein
VKKSNMSYVHPSLPKSGWQISCCARDLLFSVDHLLDKWALTRSLVEDGIFNTIDSIRREDRMGHFGVNSDASLEISFASGC